MADRYFSTEEEAIQDLVRRGLVVDSGYLCSTETCGAVEDGVEDGLQVVRRARNGAQHFRDGRLLLDEFGHPILQLRSGHFSVDTLVHAELFLGLDGEGSVTAPAAVDSLSRPSKPKMRPNIQRLLWVIFRRRFARLRGPLYPR